MTRAERNEFNYIKSSLRGFDLGYGTCLTIRTNAGHEYKQALHEHYTSLGFHPAGITTDPQRFDDEERIVYIFGNTWSDDNGNEHSWTELYTDLERAKYSAALN